MAWPTPQDFREAVQNPRAAFGDAELQGGIPEMDRLGLPRPWSGAFATVYRMRCGGRSWAVRCFLHSLNDEQERYAAISSTLASLRLPSLVGCRFVEDGIRVGPRRYPILKMEWVEGESFNRFVERHLRKPAVLREMAGRWVRLVEQLRQASLAHGDLQHGNILIAGGEFRLVDYDGMYVPALAGRGSRELGHRNFQHPRRSPQDFGPWLDHFSSWVIYVSLLALACEPGLWQRFGGGDECLLFRADDFRSPERSGLYRILERSSDRRLRNAVTLFKSLLYLPPSQVPPLSRKLLAAGGEAAPLPRPILDGGWIADHVKPARARAVPEWMQPPSPARPAAPAEAPAAFPEAPAAFPEWMRDFQPVEEARGGRIEFAGSLLPERIILVLGVLAGLSPWMARTALPGLAPAGLDGGMAGAAMLWMAARYRRDPARRQRLLLKQEEESTRQEEGGIERSLQACQEKREALEQQEEEDQNSLDVALRRLRERQRVEDDQARARLGTVMVELNQRRQQLRREESNEMQRLLAEAARRMSNWRQEESQTEPEALADRLQARQEQHRHEYLRKQTIREGCVSGLTARHLRQLRTAGVTWASELEEARLTAAGLDASLVARLLSWRKTLEAASTSGIPWRLSDAEVESVREQREQRRRTLDNRRLRERERQREEKQRLEERMQERRSQMDEEAARARKAAEQERLELQARLHQQAKELEAARAQRHQERELRRAELDREAEALGRQSFGLSWRIDDLQQRQAGCREICFRGFLWRVLGFGRR